MRKLILYTAVSMDGYIAGDGDNLDWLMAYETTPDTVAIYEALYDRIDTALMGNATYRFVVEAGVPDPYPDKKTVVFSRVPKEDTASIHYISGDIVAYVDKLKAEEGGDIWLVGGGAINNIFLKADMIDELQLTLVPVILGCGTSLFGEGGCYRHYQTMESRLLDNGMVHTTYQHV